MCVLKSLCGKEESAFVKYIWKISQKLLGQKTYSTRAKTNPTCEAIDIELEFAFIKVINHELGKLAVQDNVY